MSTFNEFCTELVAHMEMFHQKPEREKFLQILDILENAQDGPHERAKISSLEMVTALVEFAGYVPDFVPKERQFAASACILQWCWAFDMVSALESENVPLFRGIVRIYEGLPEQLRACPIEQQMGCIHLLPSIAGSTKETFTKFQKKMAKPFLALIEYTSSNDDEDARARDYQKLIRELVFMVPRENVSQAIFPILDDINEFKNDKNCAFALQYFEELFFGGLFEDQHWNACSRYFNIVEAVKDENIRFDLIDEFISDVLTIDCFDEDARERSASRVFSLLEEIKDPTLRREGLSNLGFVAPWFGGERIEKEFLTSSEKVDLRRINNLILTIPKDDQHEMFLDVLKKVKMIDDLERQISRLVDLALVTMKIEKDTTSFLSIMTDILDIQSKEQRDTALEALTRDGPLDERTHSGLRMLVSKARDPEQLLMMLAKNLPKDGEHEEERARTHLIILSYGQKRSPEQSKAFKELLGSPKDGLEAASLRKSGDGMTRSPAL
jgi:hypothetical protein